MKKAGIIVGCVIIVLAIAIWWVANMITSSGGSKKVTKPTPTPQPSVVVVSPSPTVSSEPVASKEPVIVVEPERVEDVKPVIESHTTSITEIDETTLGANVLRKEVGVIASKKLLLISNEINGVWTNQLQYVVEVLNTNSEKISLYLTESAYTSLEVGDKVLLSYKVFTNDAGIDFYVVVEADIL